MSVQGDIHTNGQEVLGLQRKPKSTLVDNSMVEKSFIDQISSRNASTYYNCLMNGLQSLVSEFEPTRAE